MMRYESHALYFSNPWHFFSGYFDILSRLKVADSNSTYIIWQLLVDFLKCFCYHIEYGFLHLNHLRLPFSFVLPNNRSFRWLVLSVLFIISRCQKYAVLNKFQCVTKMMSKKKNNKWTSSSTVWAHTTNQSTYNDDGDVLDTCKCEREKKDEDGNKIMKICLYVNICSCAIKPCW